MLLKSIVEPEQRLCAALPSVLGMPWPTRLCRQVWASTRAVKLGCACPLSSFEAVLTLGPTVGVWHFGQCLGRCEQCWEFDVISKWSSRGWLLFFQLLKVNSWTYCSCTNPNRLVGGTQCAPDERNLAITSLWGGSVKLQRNEMGR